MTAKRRKSRIGVVGLGYVGLPLAVEFGKQYETIGFDVNPKRVAQLRRGRDLTLEVTAAELKAARRLSFTTELDRLRRCQVFIVTVPTPIDDYKQPDLGPLRRASESVGAVLRRGAVVIYESTVYPGCTEEVCVPILERVSGLKFNRDFFAGYSPERINPGDRAHRLTTIRKVTSGSTPEVADFVDELYGSIVTAGTHKTSSIRVAEAAKVIENTQRDVNIALINELALIFNRLAIDTEEVLNAAGSKWNFLPFRPGLVGGHCIGVDPYYLTHKAQEIGYHPEMILAGRRLNDNMALHVAGQITQLMAARKGRMEEMANHTTGWVRMEFVVPSRGLIGFRTDFLTETRGTGIANAVFEGYHPWAGDIKSRHSGSLVSDRAGTVTPFALVQLADRGTFFVEPGQDTYQGMVVGVNPRAEDLDVNVTREKKLTNMRSSTADVFETLAKPMELDLEKAMEFCASDECVEVTPAIIRVRKVELDAAMRARSRARAKAADRA